MTDRYILVGRKAVPCADLMDWARAFERTNRIVDRTQVGPLFVSTVFLGLDHSFGDGEPLLFETMIFDDAEDSYQERCSTWEQAERQHSEAVAVARARVDAAARAVALPAPPGDGG